MRASWTFAVRAQKNATRQAVRRMVLELCYFVERQAAIFAACCLASSKTALNASGSWMAISLSILRFSATLAACNP